MVFLKELHLKITLETVIETVKENCTSHIWGIISRVEQK